MEHSIDDLLGRNFAHTCDNPDCVEKRPLKEAKQALYRRLAAEAKDMYAYVGRPYTTKEPQDLKAIPLDKLKAIMEIKE